MKLNNFYPSGYKTLIQSVIFSCGNLIFMIVVKPQKDTKTFQIQISMDANKKCIVVRKKQPHANAQLDIPDSKFSCFLFKTHSVVC